MFFLKPFLFLFCASLGIRMYLLFDYYALEIFENMSELNKKYVKTKSEKIMMVGMLKPLKFIRERNPVTFYLFYLTSSTLCLFGIFYN